MQWKCRKTLLDLRPPFMLAAVMGILNVTPDSFSDGGLHSDADAAVARYLELAEQGCGIVDIGGQSTRPGHTAICASEEWERISPVLTRLSSLRSFHPNLPLVSVDTYYPMVAEMALDAGADIINDVTGLCDPSMREVIARYGAGCVLMHCEDISVRNDPVSAVRDFFSFRAEECIRSGIAPECICLDCGIGFGKTREQEVILLERMSECRVNNLPLLAAASRKRVIAYLMGTEAPPHQRDEATHRVHFTAVCSGANIVRVHDAKGACRSLSVKV